MQCYWSLLCTQPGTFWGAFLSQLRLGIVEEKAGRVDIGEEHFAVSVDEYRSRETTLLTAFKIIFINMMYIIYMYVCMYNVLYVVCLSCSTRKA